MNKAWQTTTLRNHMACQRAPRLSMQAFAMVVLGMLLPVPAVPASAQAPVSDTTVKPVPQGLLPTTQKSSLDVPFVEVPGVPVLVAAWETRLSDFDAFVREAGYSWSHRPHFPQTGNHPVVNVNLQDAIAFCNWLTKRERDSGAITSFQSYRLPTKKEWDAAVGLAAGRKSELLAAEREMDKQMFPWGAEWPPPSGVANLNSTEIAGKDDGYTYTAPVGLFAPSAEGIYDLAGNVWEWTWDQEARPDMVGVLRGGSWMYYRKDCLLSSYEYPVPGELRAPSIGFRCVFEDRRRVAAFLAAAQAADKGQEKERREKLTSAPTVSADEVSRMRQQLENKPQARTTGVALPDVKALTPAQADKGFVNSLGMALRPLASKKLVLVGEHEVRVQDYTVCMEAQGKSWDRKPPFAYTETHPIVNVSWEEAVKFCEWLSVKDRTAGLIKARDSYRLLTDEEWSLAAGLIETGGTPEARHLANREDYPWGKDAMPPPRSANLDTARMTGYQDNFSHTAPVGSFSPNSLHLFDLAGNVSEWCGDAWPSAPDERVIRGSSWLTSSAEAMLSSSRQHLPASSARPDLGFRVALQLTQP